MKNKGLLRILRWFGLALSVAGVLFVARRLKEYQAELYPFEFSAADWFILGALTLLAAGSVVFLALGWRQLLHHCNASRPASWALRVYGVSQIAKYLPGNVFQLVGRQISGAAGGAGHSELARSALLELTLVAIVAICFTCLLIPLWLSAIGPGISIGALLLAASFVFLLVRSRLSNSAATATLHYFVFS